MTIVAATPYDAGSTATGRGIRAAMQMIQTHGRGAATPKVLVLFTDGASNTGESVASVMADLAVPLQGVTRYAVGIGSSLNSAELELFAGDAARVYSIDDYASLSDIAGAISQGSCNSNAAIAVDVPVVFQMPAAAARSFSTPIPDGGVTVRVTVSNASALGSADVYYSSAFTLPTKELSDGTAIRVNDTTLAFAVASGGAARRAAAARNGSGPSVLYYTLESKADLGQVQVLPSRGSARLAPCGTGCTACDLNGQSCTACSAGLDIVRGGCLQIPGTSGGEGGGLGLVGTALLATLLPLGALAGAAGVFWAIRARKFASAGPGQPAAADPASHGQGLGSESPGAAPAVNPPTPAQPGPAAAADLMAPGHEVVRFSPAESAQAQSADPVRAA
jgi:hypothetical protein